MNESSKARNNEINLNKSLEENDQAKALDYSEFKDYLI